MNTTERKAERPGRASFSKDRRLRNSRQFRTVYSGGRRAASRSFVVFVLPNGGDTTRFGLTTSRKLGKAHDRNRIRRRVREILRREQDQLPRGLDVVLNPRRSVLDRDWDALRTELVSLLLRQDP